MKKISTLFASFCLLCLIPLGAAAQCISASSYGSAVINNTIPGNVVTITTCQWAGEYAPITFNVTGAFTFSSSVASDYFTLTNSANAVVAFGNSPLNVVISTTGIYNLHTSASGPPTCLTQSVCRTTQVIVPIPPCSGTPVIGAIAASQALVCPNTSATITLPGASAGTGMGYQWYASSTGSLGPFAAVPNATTATYSTSPSVSVTTWYQAILTCINSAQSATSAPVSVGIAGTTTNSIPYFEGFEGTIINNQLPNCSWKASNMPVTCQTYVSPNNNNRIPRTGNKFGAFYYLPAGNSYFYSNGLKLEAGVTYSASVWYTTEYYAYTNWSNLSLMVGPNQSTVGLQPIVSSNGPAASPAYKSLSDTFSVANSGFYYIAIRANSSGACCAQYLSFDDLAVTAPCHLNQPQCSLVASSNSLCLGQNASIIAFGNNNNYAWSTGATSASISVTPPNNTNYSVTVTNTLSGCSKTFSKTITVFPVNLIGVFTSSAAICVGQQAVLSAIGANTFTWSNGASGTNLSVSPLTTASYSVIGTNGYGCNSQAAITITVNPLPLISASVTRTLICKGEPAVFTGQGGVSYTWLIGNAFYSGNPLICYPLATGLGTVTGTDNKGCSNVAMVLENVSECTGMESENTVGDAAALYPNPNNGLFKIKSSSYGSGHIQIVDAFGKLIFSEKLNGTEIAFDLSDYADGLYVVIITTENRSDSIKMIKK